MCKKAGFILLLIIFIIGCNGNGPEVAEAPNAQIVVVPQDQEKRLISEEDIDQDNCDGTAETTQTIEKIHTILYTLELGGGITVNAEGKAGVPGIGEVGLGTEVASQYQVGYGRSEAISRSLTVGAAPNSHVLHTIRQFEIWETGEIVIVAGEINQQIPYSFRRDFSIELVPPANIGCPGSSADIPQPKETAETIVEVTVPQKFFEETGTDGTSTKITVNEGEIHAMTAGKICVLSVCLPGGTDRGSVVVFLPDATYEVTGLEPLYNWHGAFYAKPDQWEIIADRLVSEQKIPGTCSDGDGCSVVDVVILSPEGILEQYQE
ncbi:MAG: hypothetical protein DWQ04_33990 [Chloroflexi bacterium]|nr:MAG: hypothetical protein DWQ04_33990 [Chloroflexota bacterium]